MKEFIIAARAVIPIFLTILLGYISRKANIISHAFVDQASQFVFKICLPIMLFIKVLKIDLGSGLTKAQVGLIQMFFFSIIISWLGAYLLARLIYNRDEEKFYKKKGAFIQGAFRNNFVIVGYPILLGLYSDKIIANMALATLVSIPLLNILSVLSLSDNRKINYLNIIKNPLIIAITMGFIGAYYKLRLPNIVDSWLATIGDLASPLALLTIGAFFNFDIFFDDLKEILIGTIYKLIVLPVAIGGLAYLLGFDTMNIILLIVAFGGPTAVSSFAMTAGMGGDKALAGNFIIVTTALCMVTYIIIMGLFMKLG